MHPRSMVEIVNRTRYSTETALLVAGDDYWDGHNYERRGRNTFLYRSKRGKYFAVHQTQWQGEQDRLEPLDLDEAISLYENLSERRLEYEEAFPGIEVEEA